MWKVDGCSKTLAIIILGPKQHDGCIWCETNFATSVPYNSAFMLDTQVLHHFEHLLNASKCSQTSFKAHWSWMHAFGVKPFLQPRYPEIVHSLPKQKFCIFLLNEGYWDARKHSKTTFLVQWSRMNAFFATSVPRNSALKPETQVLSIFAFWRFPKCSKTLPNIILGPRD
jgi:hypothetical protein